LYCSNSQGKKIVRSVGGIKESREMLKVENPWKTFNEFRSHASRVLEILIPTDDDNTIASVVRIAFSFA
jgi:hypothetical protein